MTVLTGEPLRADVQVRLRDTQVRMGLRPPEPVEPKPPAPSLNASHHKLGAIIDVLDALLEKQRMHLADMAAALEIPASLVRLIAPSAIAEAVAEAWSVPLTDLLGPRRLNEFAKARAMAYAACKHFRRDLSMPAIGRIFNRDHTTIMHGVEAHKKRLQDPSYAAKWNAVCTALDGGGG